MWPVAEITFLEGFRSRVLYGIFLFSIFVMILSIVFANFFMHDIGKIAVDFNLSAISLAGLLMAFSISVNLIAQDLDKKTIHFVLSKPISRSRYILGKYFGILGLTTVAYLILSLISGLALLFIHFQSPDYFKEFRVSAYILAILLDLVKLGLLNAVILFFGTITTSGFINTLFAIGVYIIGQTMSEVVRFLSLDSTSEVSPLVQLVVTTTRYLVPNFELFDIKVLAAHGIFPEPTDVFFFVCYGALYSVTLLFAASLVFERKEFA